MTNFPTHTIETAPEAAKPLLQGAKSAYSFIPNLLGTMAEAPALLEGYMTLAGILRQIQLQRDRASDHFDDEQPLEWLCLLHGGTYNDIADGQGPRRCHRRAAQ